MQAEHLADALLEEFVVVVEAREAADVDRPQIQRRLPLHDPFGERAPCPAAGNISCGKKSWAIRSASPTRSRPERAMIKASAGGGGKGMRIAHGARLGNSQKCARSRRQRSHDRLSADGAKMR